MKKLTIGRFAKWLDAYGWASKENDARASAGLFAQDARYYETPFADPIVGRDAIYQYWDKGARTLKDKESTYEIFSVKGNLGIARWQSTFTLIESGRRVALDCLFLVEFDEDGKCSLFREWWHAQTIESAPQGRAG